MIKNFDFEFYLRNSKTNKKGESAIYVKLEASSGNTFRISTSIYVFPKYWDEKTKLVKRTHPEAKKLNLGLERALNIYEKKQRQIQVQNLNFNKRDFLNFLKGEENRENVFLDLFKERINEIEELKFSPSTVEVYKHTLTNLQRCFDNNKWYKQLSIEEFSYRHIMKFEAFLTDKRGCTANSIAKYQKTVKAVLNDAIKKDLITKNPFSNYTIKWVQNKRPCLTIEELNKIRNKEIKIPRLNEVKNLFLLSCYTGLAYADLKNLKVENVIYEDGEISHLCIQRQKSKQESIIPIIDDVKEILEMNITPEKEDSDKIFDLITNQKMNAYLKEIMDLAEIKTNLTCHVARHTFATTVCLEGNVDLVSTNAILGHSKISTTMIYLQTRKSRSLEARNLIANRLNP